MKGLGGGGGGGGGGGAKNRCGHTHIQEYFFGVKPLESILKLVLVLQEVRVKSYAGSNSCLFLF